MNERKVILMNGFSYEEIDRIMKAVRKQFDPPQDIIFAKTTENSVALKVKDLIDDLTADHEFLKKNPPFRKKPGDS